MTDKQLLAFAIFSFFIFNPTSSQGPTSTSQVYCWDSGTIVSSTQPPTTTQYYQASDLTSFQTWWANLSSQSTSSLNCKVSYKNDFYPSVGTNSLTECILNDDWSGYWGTTSFRCPVVAFINSLTSYDNYCSNVGNCFQYDYTDGVWTTSSDGSSVGIYCQEYQLLMGLNVNYITYLADQVQPLAGTSQGTSIMGQLDTLLKSTFAIAILGSSAGTNLSSVTSQPLYSLMTNSSFNLSSVLHDTNWSPSNYTKSSNLFYNFSNNSIYSSGSINNVNYGNTNYQSILLTDMYNSVTHAAGYC